MHYRCYKKSNQAYRWYGAKGITICEAWHIFGNFCKWAFDNGYKNNLTIDRINNRLGYEPNNCRWVTLSENVKNTTRICIEINGDVYSVNELATKVKVNPYIVRNWLKRGKLHIKLLEWGLL
jgi:hypothetical protein